MINVDGYYSDPLSLPKSTFMNTVFHMHSGLRWLILLLIVLVTLKSILGWLSGGNYSKFDKIIGSITIGLLDVQLLLGLVLYFFYSAFTKELTFNVINAEGRFWAVDHLLLMLFAVLAAHIGKMIATKSPDASVKFRFQAIFFSISLILMIFGIPWGRLGG